MKIFHSHGHLLGGTLLIASTTIGVGMLAMPVATAPGGFFPSVAIYLICWAFMLCTGLLLIEACIWMPNDTSFISIAHSLLGPCGKLIFWIFYLFLFGTVMIAHAAGGGTVFMDLTGWPMPQWLSIFLYTAIFAPVVYLGAHSVDRLNFILISGVMLSYFGFISVSYNSVDPELLTYSHWGKAWMGLPILFTAFTYQVIVPTLMTYMHRNVKRVRLAIIFGSTIPLVVYLVWEYLILGIIPLEGPSGLLEAGRLGQNAVVPLKGFIESPHLFAIGKFFAFFALTTSYIPLALSFFDFLADGFKWKKDGFHRLLLILIVFGIPLVIALIYPTIFLVALGYAGGISCAFLFGVMPPVLVWVGRYFKHYSPETRQLPGGKPVLGFLMIFGLLVLAAEVIQQIF